MSRSPRSIAVEQPLVARSEHAAAEHHLETLARQVEPLQRHACERDHLGRQPIDDLGRDGIVGRLGEDQGREPDHRALGDLVTVDRLRELGRGTQAVVRRESPARATCAGHGRPRCGPRR